MNNKRRINTTLKRNNHTPHSLLLSFNSERKGGKRGKDNLECAGLQKRRKSGGECNRRRESRTHPNYGSIGVQCGGHHPARNRRVSQRRAKPTAPQGRCCRFRNASLPFLPPKPEQIRCHRGCWEQKFLS
ncbi:unnamed protein product, partial [Vitis vinifera]